MFSRSLDIEDEFDKICTYIDYFTTQIGFAKIWVFMVASNTHLFYIAKKESQFI